jgi:hypothetical protein
MRTATTCVVVVLSAWILTQESHSAGNDFTSTVARPHPCGGDVAVNGTSCEGDD